MVLLSVVAAIALAQNADDASRFEPRAPLNGPAVTMDRRLVDVGIAQRVARERKLQARIIWIDATANIDRYNSEEKIVALVKQIRDAGFNTIVEDVKPISGNVIYPSRLAPKLTEWRGKVLPADFDPVTIMVREAKRNGLTIFASLNAFSEGHGLLHVGPGYDKPEQQTVLYDTKPYVAIGDSRFDLSPTPNVSTPDALTLYTAAERLPAPQDGAFAVTLNSQEKVIDGFESGGTGYGVPTVPKGGEILYGTGAGAEFLRSNASPGTPVCFDTDPVFVPISQRPNQQYPLMMNPNDPLVQEYAIGIARELVRNYPFDGMIYDDRLRYGGMNADFGGVTRRQFEDRIGKRIVWPDDVFKFTVNPPSLDRGVKPGPYYEQWMAFRAETIRDYILKVRTAIDQERKGTQLGVYAGSWYGEYPALGNNWASPNADAGFWFLSPQYQRSGMAPNLDFLITGCYYPTPTVFDAMSKGTSIGGTVESAGALTNRMVRDETWCYAGIALSDFKDNPDGLVAALQAACASTQGVMVFDLSHDIEPMWPVFAKAFSEMRVPPHADREALAWVRRQRAMDDVLGKKDPPIIIAAGSSGAGQ